MPKWIWNIARELDLSNNSLDDLEDPFLDHSSSILEVLHLSSNNFKGSIQIFPPMLSILLASNNKFIGPIPLTICNTSLAHINLFNNELNGTIPSCLLNLNTLQFLDVSKIKLH